MTASSAPDLQSRLAQALAGHYRIERTLGQGGMGTVFLGRDETLDRPVAIKVISPEVGTNAEIRQRFVQEARTVARLRHPNIVAVYAAGETDGLLYFVMEYVPGESLRERLSREPRLPIDDALPILRDLALALDYAHAGGIVHRDVKPENVLLDRETGRAMLMDFGVARALQTDGRITGTGFVLGSPRYMSPEQASGDDHLDGRSDLYSLGLIAYELLTGAPAVDAPTAASVLVKHLTERLPPIRDVRDDIPEEVAAAVDRLLQKAPDDRFQRGAAFAAALVGDAFDDRTPAHQVGRTPPPSRRASGRRKRRTLVAAAVGAVAVAVAGGRWMQNRTSLNDKSWFIAPFEVQGPDRQAIDWLREGSLNMLTLSLAQWQDLHVAEYERTLDLLRAEGLEDAERVGLDQARKIAQEIGAGRVVMGRITSIGDSIIVEANLYDASTGKSIDNARSAALRGPDPRPLFEAVATELLDLVGAPRLTFELSRQTTTSVAAYRAYLDGLRHLNAWRLDSANVAFDRAIGADSTFSLAYYKKALTMGWIPDFDPSRLLASQKAVASADRLPQRLQELVKGHDELTKAFYASQNGDTGATRANFLASRNRLARLVESDSTDAEAWYALADADFHLVQGTRWGSNPDTAARYGTESLRGFQRTLKLDPSFHLALSHMVQIYAWAAGGNSNVILVGDSLRAAGTPENERRIGTPQEVAALRTAARLKSRDAAAGWAATDPDAYEARRELASAYVALRQPDSAIAVLREAVKRPLPSFAAFRWQIPLLMVKTGKPGAGAEMATVLERNPVDSIAKMRVNDRITGLLAAVTVGGASGMPSMIDRAVDVLSRTDPTLPNDTIRTRDMMSYYATGMKVGMGMPMSAGMRSQLAGAVRGLEMLPANRRDISIPYMVYLETRDPLFADAARKWSAPQLQGLPEIQALTALDRRDTATALRLARDFPTTDSLRRATTLGMNGMRLVARAEVILESIDPARFGMSSNPEPGWPLYVRSFLERGILYERLGERDRAIASYERFLELWKDAEAPLQPQLRQARDAVARLRDASGTPVKAAKGAA
jgi:serine/threonine-protein kinase